MVFTQDDFAMRHARVRENMTIEGLDAVLAYSNVRIRGPVAYLANYFIRQMGKQSLPDGSYQMFGSSGVFFSRDGEAVLVTDQEWDLQRANLVSVIPTRYADNMGVEFGRLCKERGYKKVGIDNWFIFPAMYYLPLADIASETAFVPTQVIENTYKVKTAKEIDLIREAERVAVEGVKAGFAAVGAGVNEFTFAVAAENAMRECGGDLELAGNNVICGGPNTASGTGFPTHRDSYTMQSGDWAMFDLTPAYDGYGGDITRMIVAGDRDDLDPRLARLYETARRMHDAVIDAIRPGVVPTDLRKTAEGVADADGFASNMSAFVGHGLGIDLADPPIYYYDADPIEEGMCFTVEPCLTIPGLGGVRVEDTILVTREGCEVLAGDFPTDLTATG